MSSVHEGIIQFRALHNVGSEASHLACLTLRYVKYPGSQQLILWLPQEVYKGYQNFLFYQNDRLLEECPLENKVSGSVQLIIDTLTLEPGTYSIQITHTSGWRHQLDFIKLKPEASGSLELSYVTKIIRKNNFEEYLLSIAEGSLWGVLENASSGNRNAASSYSNSNQNYTSDEERIREEGRRILEETYANMFKEPSPYPKLTFEDQDQTGIIHFIDEHLEVSFFCKMGTPPVRLEITVPASADWEQKTNIPLKKKRETMLFIASGVRKAQKVSWRFEIRDECILFYDD